MCKPLSWDCLLVHLQKVPIFASEEWARKCFTLDSPCWLDVSNIAAKQTAYRKPGFPKQKFELHCALQCRNESQGLPRLLVVWKFSKRMAFYTLKGPCELVVCHNRMDFTVCKDPKRRDLQLLESHCVIMLRPAVQEGRYKNFVFRKVDEVHNFAQQERRQWQVDQILLVHLCLALCGNLLWLIILVPAHRLTVRPNSMPGLQTKKYCASDKPASSTRV